MSPRRAFLALDQGGSSSRAIVFDERGNAIAIAAVAVAERREGDDRVEQDPEELVRSLRAAAEACVESLGRDRALAITGAGLATQRSSALCWDRASGAALSPVLSWQDRRAKSWLDGFAQNADDVHRRTGLFLSPHYGASKLRWCLDQLPEVARARAERRLALGPLASFLAFRLLAQRPLVADPANASRTLLWNLADRDWDPALCALFGVPIECLPRCIPTISALGTFAVGGREVPFRVLTGDQSAALFAAGPPRADTAYVNVGTGAFVQRALDRAPDRLPRLLAGIVRSDETDATHVVEGTINGAGSALRWLGDALGVRDLEPHLEDWMRTESDPPLFLNGVSGLAAPFWIPDFRSRFVGEGTPAAKAVAVAESIVFLVQTILDEMGSALPPPARIQASGGLARLDGLCVRLASLSGLPVARAHEPEATARGVAWLVSGSSNGWPESERGDAFAVRDDPVLRARYQRWREEMRRAVASRAQ